MRYSIRSDMLMEMTPKSPGLLRHVRLCRVWRVACWMLLPIAYLGAFVAPTGLLSIPFQIFHGHHYSSRAFWIMTVLAVLVVAWILYLSANRWWRHFRQHVIYVEAMVLFAGALAALPIVLWIFPPK